MKVKILYVEDEPSLGRIVKESLETRDFEVTMIQDGKDAVDAFKNSKPDICVLDIMLPSKDGYTLAREIRQLNSSMPVIFLTAKTQTEDLVKGFESGGNDYIKKPFSVEELIVRINNLLVLTKGQRNDVSQHPLFQIGKYQLNTSRFELRFNEEVRKLSQREVNLIMLLLENKNGTTNRKDILMKLWGDDSFFNSRNLDVYVTKVRDYFKQDPSISIITIKGVGYHFSITGG